MPNKKLGMWWRRKRRPYVWHFMKECPSLPWEAWGERPAAGERISIKTTINPRNGTKCDHCQRLQKAARKAGKP